MVDKHLTHQKIEMNLLEDSDVNMSEKSEVFDSDKDPEYFPGDSDDSHKPTRPFERRFERQLDKQLAGTSSYVSYESTSSGKSDGGTRKKM